MLPSPQPSPAEPSLREAAALHRAGKIVEAARHYELLLKRAPDDAQLLYLLGSAYTHTGRAREGIALLEQALRARPDDVKSIEMAASAWAACGEIEQAINYFARAAELQPGSTEAAYRHAAALRRARRLNDAAQAYRRALAVDPGHGRTQVGLAYCLADLGDLGEAENILRGCLMRAPSYQKAEIALGTILGIASRFTEAAQVLRASLAVYPESFEAQKLLATALHRGGEFGAAVTEYRKAISLAPTDLTVRAGLAHVLTEMTLLAEARALLDESLRLGPGDAALLTALGRIHELEGRYAEAIACHDAALTADPKHEDAYVARGNVRRYVDDFEGALADYEAALRINPDEHAALANRGLTCLLLGRFEQGWNDYKARLRAKIGAPDLTAGTPWDGRSLAGKRVLVWTEYGLGDEIMFASLLPELLADVAHCTLVCAPRLVTLFRRSFPKAEVIALGSKITGTYDVRLPLTDAAARLRPSFAAFPHHGGYLMPDTGRRDALRRRYRAGSQNRLVGISWRSVGNGAVGTYKSTMLRDWAPILEIPDVTFVSLQYGDTSELRDATSASIINDTEIDPSGDLDGFAAQVAAMDLIISVSNTTVHVAGAQGIPTWVILPMGQGAHWYWFLDRTDSPWYPSVRLFRQPHAGKWSPVIKTVCNEFSSWRAH